MGKHEDSGHIDLHQIFLRVQDQMLANLSASGVFEHPSSCGAATEQQWIQLFNGYLPERYRATSAFIVDARGRRSRQIDLAVYDRFYSPLLFHHDSGLHIPAESVYAVFEVKQTLAGKWILDAGRKVASVRRLRRTSAPLLSAGSLSPPKPLSPIVSGILSLDVVWAGSFSDRILPFLRRLPPAQRLDLGCCLRRGSFELSSRSRFSVHFSRPEDALFFSSCASSSDSRAWAPPPPSTWPNTPASSHPPPHDPGRSLPPRGHQPPPLLRRRPLPAQRSGTAPAPPLLLGRR